MSGHSRVHEINVSSGPPSAPRQAIAPQGAVVCQFCHRHPATDVAYENLTGILIGWRRTKWTGRVCTECGKAKARESLAHNALFGWLGIPAFALNFLILVRNASQSRALRSIGAPQAPRPGGALAQGLPALLRPRFVFPTVILGTAIALVIILPKAIAVDDIEAGMCFEAPKARAEHLDQVDCADDHYGQVAGFGSRIQAFSERTDPVTGVPLTDDDVCYEVVVEFLGDRDVPDDLEFRTYQIVLGDTGVGFSLVCAVTAPEGKSLNESYAPPGNEFESK